MRKSLLLLAAGALHAAVIRGTVVESLTGRAIQRATVLIEPVPGSAGTRLSTHTDRFGFFEFNEPGGIYRVEATCAPFVPAEYGQKRWNSAGAPLTLTDNDTPFLTLRMVRYGAISGAVVDENDVGLPGFDVLAYRNITPLQLAAQATANERGEYRIAGLPPGTYLVRAAAKQIEEVGYKPTFGKETETSDQAHLTSVEIEQQSGGMNIRPIPGRLFKLSVAAPPLDPQDAPVTITIASDMGRKVVQQAGYTFSGLPRGYYDVFAEAPTEIPGVKQSAYQHVFVSGDQSVTMPLRRGPDVVFQFDGVPSQTVRDGSLRVLARRKDLAGSRDEQTVTLAGNRANFANGPWEFAVVPPDGYYVSTFSGRYRPNQRADGWNETEIINGGWVRFTLSSNPATLSGTVKDAGNAVVGAPVFLAPTDIEPARRLSNAYIAITDTRGQYSFNALAPGSYRVLSTFEYRQPDSETMESAGAVSLRLDPRSSSIKDLDLYVIR